MYQCTQTGLPVVRPLFLNDPQDIGAYNHLNDQFFLARDLLIAPVVTQHDTASPPSLALRDVYLPPGSQWYAFTDNTVPLGDSINGGTLVTNWYAPLSGNPQYTVPIFVRAGAIIPMRELEQFMGQLPQNPITFNIYPGADSSFELYQDDGETTAAEKQGAFRLTTISHAGIRGGQRVRVLRTHDQFIPPEPFYFSSFLGTNPPIGVMAAGISLPNVGGSDQLSNSANNAYYYNASIKTTFLKIYDTSADITLQVTF